MYLRDIPHLPKAILRKEFVKCVFDIGYLQDFSPCTLITAVKIGDNFVSFTGPRFSYKSCKLSKRREMSSDEINILEDLVPQVYSIELAHVALSISSLFNEDETYSIDEAGDELNNSYVFKMQWELCMLTNFTVKNENFLTLICHLIPETEFLLSDKFFDLSYTVCLDLTLLNSNPINILLSIIALSKLNKLSAQKMYRERIFKTLFYKISEDHEIPVDLIVSNYLKFKKDNI